MPMLGCINTMRQIIANDLSGVRERFRNLLIEKRADDIRAIGDHTGWWANFECALGVGTGIEG